MISFTYSDNSQALSNALESFQRALTDNEPAFAEIADDFREMMAAQFASQGAAEGTPWAPRSVAAVYDRRSSKTKSRRSQSAATARSVNAPSLLTRTGALRDSLTRKGAAGSIEEVDGQSLSIGSRVPYAIFHQFGTRRMPVRPLIGLSDARAATWTEFVQRAIESRAVLLGAKELR